jgi:3-oxoacyl-[acyl-carrier protein] reductase
MNLEAMMGSKSDIEKAQDVVKTINAGGGKAIAVSGDITDERVVNTLIQQAAKFGSGKIHIIVNNAGFTWDAVLHKTTPKQWETMLAIHCTAPFNIIKAAAPYFRVTDGESRCIVNISSQSGIHGNA